MAKIKTFNRKMLPVLDDKIVKALEELGKTHGVKVETTSGTYDTYTYTVKVKLSVEAENGESVQDVADLTRFGSSYDLTGADMNKVFTRDGKQWKLKGLFMNRRRYRHRPIKVIRMSDGKEFGLTSHGIREAIDAAARKKS
jgi:hypothetical protein